jgi:hypothetical protein
LRLRVWLEWQFVKEGFKNLFWNFHYMVLFGIFTLIFAAGVVTLGPGVMALASSIRVTAMDEKVTIGFYFTEFKRLFVPGLFLSIIVLVLLASLWSSLNILASGMDGMEKTAAYTAIAIITVLSFFLFYYPFAGFEEKKISRIIIKSFIYTVGHLWDTVVQISIIYILWRILSISPPILVLMFLPLSFFIVNRFIIANNKAVDEAADDKEEI